MSDEARQHEVQKPKIGPVWPTLKNYTLLKQLQAHAARQTYVARSHENKQEVIVKELRVGQIKHVKHLELFEREVNTLKKLKDARIPKILDHFQVQAPEGLRLYLVTEKLPGRSLQEWRETGWRPDAETVQDMAMQILDILQLIHQQGIVHRDIKPSNILRDEAGQLYLIDFGAVQDVFRPAGSSTVVGSFGYMAPEQFSGRAVPASDVYALAATLLEWTTGLSAAEIPRQGLALDLEAVLPTDSAWKHWLKQALAPHLNQRFGSAEQALNALKFPETRSTPSPRRAVATPLKRMLQQQENDTLFIQQQGLRSSLAAFHFALAGLLPALLVFCLSSMMFWGNEGNLWPYMPWIWALTSLPVLYGTYKALYLSVGKIELSLTPETLQLKAPGEVAVMGVLSDISDIHLPLRYQRTEIPLQEIESVEVEKIVDAYALKIRRLGVDEILCSGMSGKETVWLQAQILQYLYEHQAGAGARSILVQLKQVRERNQNYFGF